MTVTVKVLIDPLQAPAAETMLYTSPVAGNGGRGTIIDKFTGTNTTAAAVLLTVRLVKLSGAPGASNTVVAKSIPANDVYTFPELVGHVLNPGDFISVLAATATAVTVRASGRELS